MKRRKEGRWEKKQLPEKMHEEPEMFCYWLGDVAVSWEDEQLIGGKIDNSNRGNKLDFAIILSEILLYTYLNLFSVK